MEQINKIYSGIGKFESAIDKISKVLNEILVLENSIIKPKYLESEVSHIIKILEKQRAGIDRRLDLTFYLYNSLVELHKNFSSALSILNKKEKDIYFLLQSLIEEYYQTCVDIEPKYKVSAIEYFEFIALKRFWAYKFNEPPIKFSDSYLIFLDDRKLIIFPLREMLCILLNESDEGLGNVVMLEKTNRNNIYVERSYKHWGGVGKDDWDEVNYYMIDPFTLQIKQIDKINFK